MLNKVQKISIDFITNYIPNCHAAMITGSFVHSEMNELSDIDILILDSNITRDYFESINFQGYKIDCIILPLVNINDILMLETERNNIVYIDMLSKGIIIKDTFESLANLKSYVEMLHLTVR